MDKLLIALLISVAFVCIPGLVLADVSAVDVNLGFNPGFSSSKTIAQETEGIEIRTITVTGLSYLNEEVVITGLTIKAGDRIVGNVSSKRDQAAEALYNTGWFSEKPKLDLDYYEGGAILKVTVSENPIYTHTTVQGNTLKSTEAIISKVEGEPGEDGKRHGAHLVPGQIINLREIVAATDDIRTLYSNDGYIAAGVVDWGLMPGGDGTAGLSLRISEGLCDTVLISGLSETRESVVSSQITHIRADRIITSQDLQRDMQQIYNTGLFDSVNPRLQDSLREGYVHVVFDVVEATTGQAGVGLGYSTVNGLQGTLSYNEKNLFGSGKELNTTLIFSANKPGFQIGFSDPYFTKDGFYNISIFNMHNKQQRYPGTAYESELSIDSQGLSLGYGERINDYDSWMISTGLTDYDYRINKGDPFRGYTAKERARLSASGQTRKLGGTFSHDTRDNRFSTTDGYLGTATMETAGFGGDFNFTKFTVEGREFYKLGPGTLAMRQRMGTASGDVPIYEEYNMGGVASIRGVSEDILSGTQMVLANIEYRYQISDMFGAVAFVDGGWAGTSFSEMDSASGAGLGARIKIKAIGSTVRLDYGWELSGDPNSSHRFHFFLGEMF